MSLSRRAVLVGGTAALAVGAARAGDDPAGYLGATDHLDHGAANVRALVAQVTGGMRSPTTRALALFSAVKNRIGFGFASGFWNLSASETLDLGVGFCLTKATLFTAALRAADVPARQVFVDIDAAVLHGLLEPGTPYVDHCYVEAWLDDAWRATDAFIVDDGLFGPAQRRVLAEGRVLGYGVHATGTSLWDSSAPTFAQWNRNDPRPIGARTPTVYADVGDFYARAEKPWSRLNALSRASFGWLGGDEANRRIEALRQAG